MTTCPLHVRPRRGQLAITPVTLKTACAFVTTHHRHLAPPPGAKLAVGVRDFRGRLRGVALLGRPIARELDNGLTAEVTRVATDGCANACSALYGAVRRIAIAMGYTRVVTYTRTEEPGTSLRAAGWSLTTATRGGSWNRGARRPRSRTDTGQKRRWEAVLPANHHA